MHVIWQLGFRPFFLLGSLSSAIFLLLWIGLFAGYIDFDTFFPPIFWHAHEMVYGFVIAIVSGFILTASAKWTGIRGLHGNKLILLVAVWILGRLAIVSGGVLPPLVISAIDLIYLPLLILFLSPYLLRPEQKRNMIFILLLSLLFVGNLLMHLDQLGLVEGLGRSGLYLGVNCIIVMLILIGGRIIPMFTRNAIPEANMKLWPLVEIFSIVSALFYVLSSFVFDIHKITGSLALVAAISNSIRLYGWQPWKTYKKPILWILHIGYLWLVLGFYAVALSYLWSLMTPSTAIHFLTVGSIGSLVLGMISRVSLGHTGRPLEVRKWVVFAYWLMVMTALFRILMPLVLPQQYIFAINHAAYSWALAYLVFFACYWKILTKPRVDGQPG
jgi:uncharacterized protein involved in response to NO